MGGLGGFLILMGVGSFFMNMMGMEFRLLMWIDNWGAVTGNIIRVAIAVLGVVLVVLASNGDDE